MLAKDTLAEILNATPECLAVSTLEEGRFLIVSDGFERLFGYSRAEVIGRTSVHLNCWAINEDRQRLIQEAKSRGSVNNWETKFRRKSGELFDVAVSMTPIVIGEQTCLIGLTTDLSKRNQAQEESRRNEERMRRALEEVQEKQALLQSIASNVPGVVYQFVARADGSMAVSYIAGRAIEFFGVPQDVNDVLGWFISRLDPEDQQRFIAVSRQAIETLGPWRFEGRFNKPSGDKIWVQGMSLPQVQGQGIVFNGVFLDVTEQKRAEQELRRSQERYERVLSTSQDGVWMSDAEFRTVFANQRLASMLGYTAEEMARLSLKDVHPQEDWPEMEQRLNERRKGGHSVHEARMRRRDGSCIWASVSSSAMMDPNGQFEGAFAMINDITVQKNTAESLRQSEESYRALFDNAQDAIFLVQDNRVVRFNRRALEMFGITEEQIRASSPYEFSPVRQPDGSISRDEASRFQTAALAGHPQLFEWVHQRGDGVTFDTEVSLSRVDLPGAPVLQAVVRDISDRKRAEAQQHALQSQLVQAQKMEAVGQLAGGVAHDFNNIITAILMHLNLLRSSKQMPPALVSGLAELEIEAKRAANLTRQLLMFSRRQVLQPEVLDVNSLLGNLLKMLRRLIGEHISLIFDGTPEDLWVEADPGMLEQVVVNLVVNARDAMPDGGSVTITTRQVVLDSTDDPRNPAARPGHFVCLEVSDTGCGIDPSAMKHIFEPFFTTKDESKGTGLGLATVYGIISQHDGWVDVESKVGQGSRFRVFLPSVPHGPARGHASVSESVPGGHETILLVEDEDSVRHCAGMMLRELGYEVLEALAGGEAFDIWKTARERISLLVTDMVMPGGVTGLDLTDRLLRDKPSLKVILMSGYSNEMARIGGLGRKNLIFLQKPFGAPTLARAVRDSLDANGKGYISTYGNTPGRS